MKTPVTPALHPAARLLSQGGSATLTTSHWEDGVDPVLSLSRVSKSFQPAVPVLRDISLQVEAGTMVCLLGPSGCGKTTLLRLIAGFEAPDAGEIYLIKRLVSRPGLVVPPEQRHIGMVFQDYALFPHMTVRRNIAFGLFRWPAAWRRTRLAEMLRLVGLEDLAERYPHELSGGQQQRVAIARVLVQDPDVILADEPVSAVDPSLAVSIVTLLRDLSHESRKTLLMNLHSVDLALGYFPRIVGVRDGRVRFDLSPDRVGPELLAELYAGHRDEERQLERLRDGQNPLGAACRPLPGFRK